MARRPSATRRVDAGKSEPFGSRKRGLAVAVCVAALAASSYFATRMDFRTTLSRSGNVSEAQGDGYIDGSSCAGCHESIWNDFQSSGMARSFAALTPAHEVADWETENVFRHAPSRREYKMFRRDGRYFIRRWQTGFDGREENVVEQQIDYVMGSGLKARTYLSRTETGELLQLPVGWYAENGGFWAMSPGYDRYDHDGFRRRVQYDCMFCHNAYPSVAPGQDKFDAERIVFPTLPAGIDCQRCHGPGRRHMEAVGSGSSPEIVRSAIVNPARLSSQRRLEVCLQCHLQSTSTGLPYALERQDRGVFSYRPGEPLGDYVVHFDHQPGSRYEDKFEIAHAAYRLLKSACFRESRGELHCTTCHDPHRGTHRASEHAGDQYRGICARCHAEKLRSLVAESLHTPSSQCASCHMPQRRTDDVVHVVMTDHLIGRPDVSRGLLDPKREVHGPAYEGEVVPYYPPGLPTNAEDELDIAIAQVKAGSNLAEGIPRLAALLARSGSHSARHSFELAEALRRAGMVRDSLQWYERTIERSPEFLPGLRSYGMALVETGDPSAAEAILRKALELHPDNSRTLHNLGLALLRMGRFPAAVRSLEESAALQPDSPSTQNALASALYESGDPERAESAFREAVRLQPDYTLARVNLARLLEATGRRDEAAHHFEQSTAGKQQ